MSNSSDPMFARYADMDFGDAKPEADVPALARLQAAHGGKSRITIRVDNATLAQLRIKRLCHIEIARWQIGGDVVSHGSAQLVGHAGRMSDCGAAIGGGMAHHDHAGLGERRTKRAR